jgi:hypothetical protein
MMHHFAPASAWTESMLFELGVVNADHPAHKRAKGRDFDPGRHC